MASLRDSKILVEVKTIHGGTKRVETTWYWYLHYGWSYTAAILTR